MSKRKRSVALVMITITLVHHFMILFFKGADFGTSQATSAPNIQSVTETVMTPQKTHSLNFEFHDPWVVD